MEPTYPLSLHGALPIYLAIQINPSSTSRRRQMLRKLRERMESERGFTLTELIVVILIIGILAAIALPAFLGQRQKGQDADAKSNARNLVSHTESWYSTNQSYTGAAASPDVTNSGLPLGGGQGQVELTSANGDSYTIVG